MKKISINKTASKATEEMLPEYKFNYSQARPNRFAGKISKDRLVVQIDPEVAQIFPTAESINTILRAVVSAIPKNARSKTGRKQKRA